MQLGWRRYAAAAHKCCSKQFWTVFNTVRDTSITARDKVLGVVKGLMQNIPRSVTGHKWPKTCRGLRQRVGTHLRDVVYVSLCPPTSIYVFVYVSMCSSTSIYVFVYVRMCSSTLIDVFVYVIMCTSTSIYMFLTFVWLFVCAHIPVRLCQQIAKKADNFWNNVTSLSLIHI